MVRFVKISIFNLLAIVFLSCTKSLGPLEYVKWLNDPKNNLIVKHSVKNFSFSAQFKTPEFMALIDQGPSMDSKGFEKKISEYKGFEYYTFRIGSSDQSTEVLKNGVKTDEAGQVRLSYFSSGIEKDIRLACGNDTFPCAIFLFERTYKMAPFENFLLAFDLKDKDKKGLDRVLVFDDKNLGVKKVEITILKQSINSIPNLKPI